MSKRKTAATVDYDNPRKDLLRLFSELARSHSTWKVFEDFLALSAISFSNTVDRVHSAEREKEYLSVIASYSKEEIEQFPHILACLVESLERQNGKPEDILGLVFHDLNLHDKWQGQFFTPPNVCEMMAKTTLGENDSVIERKGYLSVIEPCCGSGAMTLAMAGAMVDCGYNPQQQMFVYAVDTDINCVRMTYLQLALHGIPTIVRHGNSLTDVVWSEWFTPMYVFGGWSQRLQAERFVESVLGILSEPPTPLVEPPRLSASVLPVAPEFAESNSGQFMLF